jgi:hypothetical protein
LLRSRSEHYRSAAFVISRIDNAKLS